MRLARLCIHDEIKEHLVFVPTEKFPARALPFESCPGGEFLPEGTLVKVRWCQEHLTANQFDAEQWICPAGKTTECRMVEAVLYLDALASQVGESER